MEKKKKDDLPDHLNFHTLSSKYVFLLRVFAVFPLKNHDFDFIVTRLLRVVWIIQCICHSSVFFFYGFLAYKAGIIDVDYICEITTVLAYVGRYSALFHNREKIHKLHLKCKSIYESCKLSEKRIVYSFVSMVYVVFWSFFVICMGVTSLYIVNGLIMRLPPDDANSTELRLLPVRLFIGGMEPTRTYWMLFVAEITLLQNATVIVLTTDTSMAFITMFICGYFRILQTRLARMNKDDETLTEADLHDKLIECIKFHQVILEMSETINEVATTIFFIQIAGAAYSMSLCCYKLISDDPDRHRFFFLLGICVTSLFLCQWAPDYLVVESEAVKNGAFVVSSFTSDIRTVKLLTLVIRRCQKPAQVLAGGMVPVSIETFGRIVKSAFSFLMVLNSTGDEQQ